MWRNSADCIFSGGGIFWVPTDENTGRVPAWENTGRGLAKALAPLLASIREIQDEFRFRIIHVPRSEVNVADFLVNDFLDHYQHTLTQPRRKKSSAKKRR